MARRRKAVKHIAAAFIWEAHGMKRICAADCPACAGVEHGDGGGVQALPEVQSLDSGGSGGGQ